MFGNLADIFNSDLFSMTSLTAAINEQEVAPSRLADVGIFTEKGVNTTSIVIEKKGNTLILVPSKPRGAPGTPMRDKKRTGVSFAIPSFPVTDQIQADEVQGVRAFGQADQMVTIQAKRDEKLASMANSLDNTVEYNRLGAIQGLVLDADGSVMLDLFDEFGVSAPATTFLDLGASWTSSQGGVIRDKLFTLKNNIRIALGNAPIIRGIWAPCGDAMFSKLSNHPELRETYMNQQAANALRGSDANDAFSYGGVLFEHYPGYGDVALDPDECIFVPMGVPDLYITRFAPAPFFDAVNTMGLPRYTLATLDPSGQKSIDLESQTNVINLCTRPDCIFKGSRLAS
jgi:hypothetical protein